MRESFAALDRTRHFYDRISHHYDLLSDASEHAIREIGIKALGVLPGQRVLEIGFGTGHGLVRLAAAATPGGRVYGVDLSPGMLSVARARVASAALENVSLTVADARALCFHSGVFDAAFTSFTLELFESDIRDVLAEVRRVLRAGGRLSVVALVDAGHTNIMIDLFQWVHRRWPHLVDCRPIDVTGLLSSAGFRTDAPVTTTMWGLPVTAVVGVSTLPIRPTVRGDSATSIGDGVVDD